MSEFIRSTTLNKTRWVGLVMCPVLQPFFLIDYITYMGSCIVTVQEMKSNR